MKPKGFQQEDECKLIKSEITYELFFATCLFEHLVSATVTLLVNSDRSKFKALT